MFDLLDAVVVDGLRLAPIETPGKKTVSIEKSGDEDPILELLNCVRTWNFSRRLSEPAAVTSDAAELRALSEELGQPIIERLAQLHLLQTVQISVDDSASTPSASMDDSSSTRPDDEPPAASGQNALPSTLGADSFRVCTKSQQVAQGTAEELSALAKRVSRVFASIKKDDARRAQMQQPKLRIPFTEQSLNQIITLHNQVLAIHREGQKVLTELLQSEWVQALNDNLKAAKKVSTCQGVPESIRKIERMMFAFQELTATTIGAHRLAPLAVIRETEWMLNAWRRGFPILKTLQKTLVINLEVSTMVAPPEGSPDALPIRKVSIVPTTRYDRIYSVLTSVLIWSALLLRGQFASWRQLRSTPMHRMAIQLKKRKIEAFTAFDVVMNIIERSYEAPCGRPAHRLGAAAGESVADFIMAEIAVFNHDANVVPSTMSVFNNVQLTNDTSPKEE
jgi:hypothetical protein